MSAPDPLEVMDQLSTFVAQMTGMKQQFVEQGWNEHNAEQAVVAALLASRR